MYGHSEYETFSSVAGWTALPLWGVGNVQDKDKLKLSRGPFFPFSISFGVVLLLSHI